jgi:hypothetical protein
MGVAQTGIYRIYDKSSGKVFEAMDVYFDERSLTIGKSGVAPISHEKDREQPRTQPDRYMTPPLVASLPAHLSQTSCQPSCHQTSKRTTRPARQERTSATAFDATGA